MMGGTCTILVKTESVHEKSCFMVSVYLITGVVRLVFTMWQKVSLLALLFTSTQDSGRRENTVSCSTESELLRSHTSFGSVMFLSGSDTIRLSSIMGFVGFCRGTDTGKSCELFFL